QPQMGVAAQRVVQPQRRDRVMGIEPVQIALGVSAALIAGLDSRRGVTPSPEIGAAEQAPDAAEIALVADVLGPRLLTPEQRDVVVVLHSGAEQKPGALGGGAPERAVRLGGPIGAGPAVGHTSQRVACALLLARRAQRDSEVIGSDRLDGLGLVAGFELLLV